MTTIRPFATGRCGLSANQSGTMTHQVAAGPQQTPLSAVKTVPSSSMGVGADAARSLICSWQCVADVSARVRRPADASQGLSLGARPALRLDIVAYQTTCLDPAGLERIPGGSLDELLATRSGMAFHSCSVGCGEFADDDQRSVMPPHSPAPSPWHRLPRPWRLRASARRPPRMLGDASSSRSRAASIVSFRSGPRVPLPGCRSSPSGSSCRRWKARRRDRLDASPISAERRTPAAACGCGLARRFEKASHGVAGVAHAARVPNIFQQVTTACRRPARDDATASPPTPRNPRMKRARPGIAANPCWQITCGASMKPPQCELDARQVLTTEISFIIELQ